MRFSNIIEVNPFFVYVIGFSLPIFLYPLNWSYLFPTLSLSVCAFFILSFIISAAIGRFFARTFDFTFKPVKNRLSIGKILIFISFGFALEFLVAGHIPFLSIIRNLDVDYREFGIPTFHVLLTSFTGFFTVYVFTVYLSERKKIYIGYLIILFLFPILVFNRGQVLLNLSSIFFVYLSIPRKFRIGMYIKILGFVLLVLFGFGILGNIRTSNQINKDGAMDANSIILTIGEAKPAFVNSVVPKEYFWAYIYVCSPLANLQFTTDHPIKGADKVSTVFHYVNSELNFDFISKRIFKILGVEQLEIEQVAPFLTVGTVFSRSFSYLGWVGMILTFIYLLCVCMFYLVKLKRSNPFFSSGIAILNCIVLFCIFDNMIAFSGLFFQLVYPLLLPRLLGRSL